MKQEKILILGACGQIGVELTLALRKLYGEANVIATDIREEHELLRGSGPYMVMDALDASAVTELIKKEIGENWSKHENSAAARYGQPGGLKKNPLAISRAHECAWENGDKSSSLESLVRLLVSFSEQAIER